MRTASASLCIARQTYSLTDLQKETAIQTIDIKEKPLALTNDGQLEAFFLGTGSAFASSLYQTNLLLIKGNAHVLVDFGMTGPAALREVAGLQPTDIEVFLPTHSHADHVGGVECLALMNRYVGMRFMNKPRLRMIITREYESMLWEQTLRGGLSCNESGQQGQGLAFQDFFEPLRPSLKSEPQRETFTITLPCGPGNELTIEMFRTMHVPEQETSWRTCSTSYGLLVDERVFFSGDTRFPQRRWSHTGFVRSNSGP